MRDVTRRQLILAGGATVGAAVVAACGGATSPTSAPTKPTEAPKPVAAATTAPAGGAAATKPAATVTTAPSSAATTAPAKPAVATKPAAAPAPTAAPKYSPGGAAAKDVVFWHVLTGPQLEGITKIINEYNGKATSARIAPEYAGNYTQLYQKVMATIAGGGLPDLAVAYETMVADYMKANVVVALDDYVNAQGTGLTKADLDDIYPSVLNRNRFPQFGGKLLSFPFTTSNLMAYVNANLLKRAGVDKYPDTWEDFEAAGKVVKEKASAVLHGISTDTSYIDGYIFSRGGKILDESGLKTLYDQKPTVDQFSLFARMVKDGTAVELRPGSFDDQNDFAAEKMAILIRSSTTRAFLEPLVKDRFPWSMFTIPQAKDNKQKATVQFGANIAIFKSNADKQQAAWNFIKHFSSTEVTSEWATVSGYIPVRKSGGTAEPYKSFVQKNPSVNGAALDNLPWSLPEPNVVGWQDVRPVVETAYQAAISGKTPPEQAAKKLKADADKLLKEKNS